MAHIPIREYDAKRLLSEFLGQSYDWVLVRTAQEAKSLPEWRWVVKPDQCFGKRAKHGLVAVDVSASEAAEWIHQRIDTIVEIDGVRGILDTFLIEPYIEYAQEWYASIECVRDGELVRFCGSGGVDIESEWENTREYTVSIDREPNANAISEALKIPRDIADFFVRLVAFVREYGFVFFEINPLVCDSAGRLRFLDAVARIDDCEVYRQKNRWKDLGFPPAFSAVKTETESYIESLDRATGASLKLTILHPDAPIWLLTSGGGGSVIIADTLADRGYATDIANYGECSGNPDRDNTREYARALIRAMLDAKTDRQKYLIIAGAIANFTHIDKTFAGIIDALEEYQVELVRQRVILLIRRGGINDTKGLAMMRDACDRLGICVTVADANEGMVNVLEKISIQTSDM